MKIGLDFDPIKIRDSNVRPVLVSISYKHFKIVNPVVFGKKSDVLAYERDFFPSTSLFDISFSSSSIYFKKRTQDVYTFSFSFKLVKLSLPIIT